MINSGKEVFMISSTFFSIFSFYSSLFQPSSFQNILQSHLYPFISFPPVSTSTFHFQHFIPNPQTFRKPYRKKILIDLFISLFDIKIYLMECSIIQFSLFFLFCFLFCRNFYKNLEERKRKFLSKNDDIFDGTEALNVIDLRYWMLFPLSFSSSEVRKSASLLIGY